MKNHDSTAQNLTLLVKKIWKSPQTDRKFTIEHFKNHPHLKQSTVIGLVAAGGILFWLGRKALAAGNLVFSPSNSFSVRFDGAPIIDFQVVAQNTSSADLLLNSFAGNLSANGTFIGNVSNFTPQEIAGNRSTPINLEAQLNLIGVTNDVIRSIQNKSLTQNLKLNGSANVQGIQVPIDLEFTVGP